MKKYIFLIFFVICSQAFARDIFLSGQIGYGRHNQDSMEKYNTYPTGLNYAAGFGLKKNYYEFEVLASRSKYAADITHDNAKNRLINDQFLTNISLNFYLLRKLYIRLGYGLSVIKQETEKKVEGASGEGLQNAYGLEENKVGTTNIGLGIILNSHNRIKLFGQYEYFSQNEISANQSLISFGLRWYL